MKKHLVGSLKVIIPLGLGIFLVWYYFQGLSDNDLNEIVGAFERANYFWVGISLVAATLSHISRAYRWKYPLEALGYKPQFANSFFSVMIGYLLNLAVPRLGEVSRCGFMHRYEKIPFEKLLGTVIAERVADAFILLLSIVAVVFLQYEVIQDLLNDTLSSMFGNISVAMVFTILIGLGIAGIGGLVFIYRVKSENKVIQSIQKIMKGLVDGALSIVKMKKKWAFIFHTLFIWTMYVMMFYLCFFSLPETAHVPFQGVLTAFVLGGITIAATNGGIGAYPLAVQAILALYGVDKTIAGAFGWIVWTAQTVMILVLGALAFTLMPIYNRSRNEKDTVSQA